MPTRDRVLLHYNQKLNVPGTLRENKVFGFWGEYGRKAET
jgi:hypothetical protein